jgi:hypothetical protein
VGGTAVAGVISAVAAEVAARYAKSDPERSLEAVDANTGGATRGHAGLLETQVVLDLAEMRANLGDCIGGAPLPNS